MQGYYLRLVDEVEAAKWRHRQTEIPGISVQQCLSGYLVRDQVMEFKSRRSRNYRVFDTDKAAREFLWSVATRPSGARTVIVRTLP